jgi:putative oxidoreductase
MRSKAVIVARVLLGLVFFVFGLNGFLHWFPLPTMKGAAAEFMGGLVASGYFFPLLFGTYTITGAVLLTGRFVPLALTVLAPVRNAIAMWRNVGSVIPRCSVRSIQAASNSSSSATRLTKTGFRARKRTFANTPFSAFSRLEKG